MSSTNRGATRSPRDFYPTPAQPVWSLLRVVGHDLGSFYGGRYLEPGVGTGSILRAVSDYPVTYMRPCWDTIDIHRYRLSMMESLKGTGIRSFEQKDYLTWTPRHNYDVIMTNPPFDLAQEFIDHSREICPNALIIMLLRLGFLGSKKRSKWWQGKEPDAIYVLSERPDFTGGGGDSADYAWYFWNWHRKEIRVLEPWEGK